MFSVRCWLFDVFRKSRAALKLPAPECETFLRARFGAGAVGVQTGGDDPGLAEMMIENHEAVVKTDMAIGKFKVVDRAARQARLDKIFQVVTPITKTAAERERQIHFVEQFVTGHQRIQDLPWIAELVLRVACSVLRQFTTRAEGTKG